jgi:anti-sigma regulatory factor (Ser/Thr protein kinase)
LTHGRAAARTLTREWYRHWRAPEHVITGGELVATELVTNVVTKAKSGALRLRIRWHGQSGYIEVWDADPNPPVPRDAEATDLSAQHQADPPGGPHAGRP